MNKLQNNHKEIISILLIIFLVIHGNNLLASFAIKYNNKVPHYQNIIMDKSEYIKIYFERSGGIEGIPRFVTLDNKNLSEKEILKLNELLNDTKFFDLSISKTKSYNGLFSGAADYFTYKISIETNKHKTHTLTVNDLTMPEQLVPLVEFLIEKLP